MATMEREIVEEEPQNVMESDEEEEAAVTEGRFEYPIFDEERSDERTQEEAPSAPMSEEPSAPMSDEPVNYPTLFGDGNMGIYGGGSVEASAPIEDEVLTEGFVPSAPQIEDDEAHLMHPAADVYNQGDHTIASPTSLVSYQNTVKDKSMKDTVGEKGKELTKSAAKETAQTLALGTAQQVATPFGAGAVGAIIDYRKDGDAKQAAAVGVGATGGAAAGVGIGLSVGTAICPGIGTVAGGFVGAAIGSMGGTKLFRKAYKKKVGKNGDDEGKPAVNKEWSKAARKMKINGEQVIKSKSVADENRKEYNEVKRRQQTETNKLQNDLRAKKNVVVKRHKAEMASLVSEQKPVKQKLLVQRQKLAARQKEEEQTVKTANANALRDLQQRNQQSLKVMREELTGSNIPAPTIQQQVKEREQQNSREKNALQKEGNEKLKSLQARNKQELKALDNEQSIVYRQLQDQQDAFKKRQEDEITGLKKRQSDEEQMLAELLKKELDVIKAFHDNDKERESNFEMHLSLLLDRQKIAVDELEKTITSRIKPIDGQLESVEKKYEQLNKSLAETYDSQIASCSTPPITPDKLSRKQELERKKIEQQQGFKIQKLVEELPLEKEKKKLEIMLKRQKELMKEENDEQLEIISRDFERQRRLFSKSIEVEKRVIEFDAKHYDRLRDVENQRGELIDKLQNEAGEFAEEIVKERSRFQQSQMQKMSEMSVSGNSNQQQLNELMTNQERQRYEFDVNAKQKMDNFRASQKREEKLLDDKIDGIRQEYNEQKQKLIASLQEEYAQFQGKIQEEVAAEQALASERANERFNKSAQIEEEVKEDLLKMDEENKSKFEKMNMDASQENEALRVRQRFDIESSASFLKQQSGEQIVGSGEPQQQVVPQQTSQLQTPAQFPEQGDARRFTQITFSDPLTGGKDYRFPIQIESNSPEFQSCKGGTMAAWVIIRRCDDFSRFYAKIEPIAKSNGILLSDMPSGRPKKVKIAQWRDTYNDLLGQIMGNPTMRMNPIVKDFLEPTKEDMGL